VVYIRGKEYSEIKFIIRIFANCELTLWLCKIPVWRKECNAKFSKLPISNLLLNKIIVSCMPEVLTQEITIIFYVILLSVPQKCIQIGLFSLKQYCIITNRGFKFMYLPLSA